MPAEEAGPAGGGQSTEDEDAQIGEVRHDDQVGESRIHGVHGDDGTPRTS
jgi:hypothetical protein